MAKKSIFTRGFGAGLGVIKDIITRGFSSGLPPATSEVDFAALKIGFIERDSVSFIERSDVRFIERGEY